MDLFLCYTYWFVVQIFQFLSAKLYFAYLGETSLSHVESTVLQKSVIIFLKAFCLISKFSFGFLCALEDLFDINQDVEDGKLHLVFEELQLLILCLELQG